MILQWLRKVIGLCEHQWEPQHYVRISGDFGCTWTEQVQYCDNCKKYRRVKV